MFNLLNIAISILIIFIVFMFFIRENFSEVIKESDSEIYPILNDEDIDNKKDSKAFFKMKAVDPRDAIWDHKIDYCLNRGGTIDDIDLKETLLNYKPKIILY